MEKLIEFREPTKRERAFGKSLEPLARKFWSAPPLRSIVHEPLFAESLAALIPLAEEADDYVMAAKRVQSSPWRGRLAVRRSGKQSLPMFFRDYAYPVSIAP